MSKAFNFQVLRITTHCYIKYTVARIGRRIVSRLPTVKLHHAIQSNLTFTPYVYILLHAYDLYIILFNSIGFKCNF